MSRKIYVYNCPNCGGREKSHYRPSYSCAYCGKPYPKHTQIIASIKAFMMSIL